MVTEIPEEGTEGQNSTTMDQGPTTEMETGKEKGKYLLENL